MNKFLAYFVLATNLLYFYWITAINIYTTGGPFGFGIIFLPITLIANAFSISAIMILVNKEPELHMVRMNQIGALYCFVFSAFVIYFNIHPWFEY